MKKYLFVFIGLGIALFTLLATFLIWGTLLNDFYLWGVMQLIFSLGYFALAWIIGGLINRNIRREANNKLADTSFKNPKKAEYKMFILSCYFATLFGVIFNFIGYYAFGMGKFVDTVSTFIKIL